MLLLINAPFYYGIRYLIVEWSQIPSGDKLSCLDVFMLYLLRLLVYLAVAGQGNSSEDLHVFILLY